MPLILDVEHDYYGHWTDGARCRVRVYSTPERPVILLTELPANENTSITNLIEQVCAEVIRDYLAPRGLFDPSAYGHVAGTGKHHPIFIEHYPHDGRLRTADHDFSRVDFSSYSASLKVWGNRERWRLPSPPRWSPLSYTDVSSLIGESAPVETVRDYLRART